MIWLLKNPETTSALTFLTHSISAIGGVIPWTTDSQWSFFSLKFRFIGLGQTNLPNKFWSIRGIFGQTITTHFDTVLHCKRIFPWAWFISNQLKAGFLCFLRTVITRKICFNLSKCVLRPHLLQLLLSFKNNKLRDQKYYESFHNNQNSQSFD